MKKLHAFILGVLQFRSDLTARFDDLALSDAYDYGRELAHCLTLRKFDK